MLGDDCVVLVIILVWIFYGEWDERDELYFVIEQCGRLIGLVVLVLPVKRLIFVAVSAGNSAIIGSMRSTACKRRFVLEGNTGVK